MSFNSELQQASYNGVTFSFKQSTTGGGKTLAVHKLPFQKQPYIAETGWTPKEISLTAFISGEGYLQRGQELLNELNKEGTGRLVHPMYGLIKVYAGVYKYSQSSNTLGYTEISISFVEAQQGKELANSTRSSVITSAQSTAIKAKSNAVDNLKLNGLAKSSVTALGEMLHDFSIKAMRATQRVNNATNTIASLQSDAEQLKQDISKLIDSPEQLVARVFSATTSLAELMDTPELAISGARALLSPMGFSTTQSILSVDKSSMDENTKELNQAGEVINATKASVLLIRAVDYSKAGESQITRKEATQIKEAIFSKLTALQNQHAEEFNDEMVYSISATKLALANYIEQAELYKDKTINFEQKLPLVVAQYYATEHPQKGRMLELNDGASHLAVTGETRYAS